MDDKSILLMSEELRTAMGQSTRASIESKKDDLPGRWSKKSASEAASQEANDTIRIPGRVTKCSAIKGGGVRLIVEVAENVDVLSQISIAASLKAKVRVVAGVDCLKIDLMCTIRSGRIEVGDQRRVSLLVDPAS